VATRPPAVTAVCLLGAIAALITLVLMAVDALWAVPPSPAQKAVVLVALALTVTALVGMWRMRRWGVLLFGALFLVRVALGIAGQVPWNLAGLTGPLVLLLVGLVYVRRMT
jgi:hypothetical protein